jgi:signal transduction histidine kinase
MHTPLLTGSLTFFVLASVCLSYLFLRAWLARREDREYLVFGMVCASLAAHSGLGALIYARDAGLAPWAAGWPLFRLVVVPSKAASALTFHFALLYARVRRSRLLALPIYVLMAAFAIFGTVGSWWAHIGEPLEVEWLGLSVLSRRLVPTEAAQPFYLVVPVLVAACIYLFGRTYLRTGRGLGAWIGSVFFGAAVVNDLGLGAGWFRSVPLFAAGFLAFTYGVALTLLSRYAHTASELARNTEELRARSRELERSYADLSRTQQELVRSEQLAVIGELAAVIAHEVRNPLAIVGNAVASLRKRHTTRDDRRTLLEIINEEMGRLDKLVGRLINYARPVVVDRRSVDLEQVVAQAAKVVEGIDVELSFEVKGRSLEVMGDSELLRQSFENLLSNAAQATRGRGEIQVRLGSRNVGGVAVRSVEIEDRGEGMAPEQLESALTPFFTTRPTGTGLGLPIVARIVEAHGGQIQLDSEEGEGTRVTVMLPVSAEKRLQPIDENRVSLLP